VTRALLIAAVLAGCYNPPQPDCAFVCGPGGACPADYTCAADHRCHRNGAPDSLMCPALTDGGVSSAPHVLSIVPLNGAMDVALDTMPSFVADQELVGVTDQTFYVLQDIAPIAGRVDHAEPSAQARFVPDLQLAEFSFYRVEIAAGITNVSGSPLAPFEWSFITGADTAPPRVTMTMPANAQADLPTSTNIVVAFDEDVTGVDTTSFTVDAGAPIAGSISPLGASQYTFAPATLLPSGATITVTLGTDIQDVKGNPFAGYRFSFTTQ
jgi:hypothetical protein